MKKLLLILLLIAVSCNNESKTASIENPVDTAISSTNPTDFIKALHRNGIRVAKLTPHEATSSLILKYEDEFVNSINISKEIDVSSFMKTDSLDAKVILYSFSLGTLPFKDDLILIKDENGNLKYKSNYYLSTYSSNRKLKAIATIVDNWTDGSTVYDYYGIKSD